MVVLSLSWSSCCCPPILVVVVLLLSSHSGCCCPVLVVVVPSWLLLSLSSHRCSLIPSSCCRVPSSHCHPLLTLSPPHEQWLTGVVGGAVVVVVAVPLSLSSSSSCPRHCCPPIVPVLVLLVPSTGRGTLLRCLLVLVCWLSLSVAPTVHPASSCSQRWVWVLGRPSLALFHRCTFVVPFAGLTVSTLRAGARSGGVGWLLRLPIVFRRFVVVSLPFHCRSHKLHPFPPRKQMLVAVGLGAGWPSLSCSHHRRCRQQF